MVEFAATHMNLEGDVVAVSFEESDIHVDMHVVIVAVSVNNRPPLVNWRYP